MLAFRNSIKDLEGSSLMCGLVGISYDENTVLEEEYLTQALHAIRHRGPDDFGVFLDPNAGVGLAHARLSILDLSPLGHQPMASGDGAIHLVFNGEIYNFRELRKELESQGCEFLGTSDTEVLLQLYVDHRRRGTDLAATLRRLNGIFAFALWDQALGATLLVRDQLGVKPLYYHAAQGKITFASEIKALLPLSDGLGSLDPCAIDRYLTFLWCPGDGTPALDVKKLKPGELMWVRRGGIERRETWYRLPALRGVSRVQLGQDQAIDATARNLRVAVHRQMIADVPVGAFLSGGLDSSAVVAFARELDPDIRCFTIEVRGELESGTADDLPYARKVAKHLRVPLDVVEIEGKRLALDLPEMVAQLDEPLADPAPLNVLYICRLARQQGIKVLLSGAGGDDLFTGYRRHQALSYENQWRWMPASVRSGLQRATSALDQRGTLARRLRKLFSGAHLEGDERLVNYFAWSPRAELLPLYTPALREAVSRCRVGSPMTEFLAEIPAAVSPMDRMLALEQRFFLADHNLIYTDKMSMATGVEVRVPFLDLELVEFANTIPVRYKQRGAIGKWVLKRAMEPYLPREVVYRPKSGFGAPLRRWMRHELRELLGDLLGERSLKARGLFDPAAVQRLILANDKGEVDSSYTLLSLMCVELWCRRFIDGSKPIPGKHNHESRVG